MVGLRAEGREDARLVELAAGLTSPEAGLTNPEAGLTNPEAGPTNPEAEAEASQPSDQGLACSPTPPPCEPPRAGTGGRAWRPPSGHVDGQHAVARPSRPSVNGSAGSVAIGQQMREAGVLHSTQRMQLSVGTRAAGPGWSTRGASSYPDP